MNVVKPCTFARLILNTCLRYRFAQLVLLSVCFFCTTFAVQAQPKQYLLAPGDTIRIVVEGLPDYSFSEVLIRPDGQINLPIYGSLRVSGKTVPAVQTILRQRLGQRYRRPDRLTATLIRPRPATPSFVSVIGTGIRVPKRVDVGEDGMPLTAVLAEVGGPQDRAEEIQAFIARAGQPQIEIDLYEATRNPSSKANVRLRKDDVLTVNLVDPQSITLQGDVTRPGVYVMRRIPSPSPGAYNVPLRPKLMDLLVAGGMLKSPVEAGKEVTYSGFIVRNGEKIPLRLQEALNYEDSANEPLKPRDLVNITGTPVPMVEITINGLVRDPGSLELNQGDGVVQAIAKAGNLTQPVEQVVVTVQRGDQVLPVDLMEAIIANNPKANLPLQTRDIIQVSESKRIDVQVTGKVNKPLQLHIQPGAMLLDVLTQAGNISVPKTENARIKILRTLPNGRQVPLEVDAVGLYRLDLTQNVLLQDKDLVSVTEFIPEEQEKQTVFVSGEVARQGAYDLEAGEGLTEVLVRAGGPTPQAALTQIQVQRNGETKTIDMYPTLKEGTQTVKEELKRGDIIIVPKNEKRVVVMGAVNKLGDVPLPEKGGLTVLDAINQAGGFKPNAKTKEIAILRPINGGFKQINVAVVKGIPSSVEPLRPNDAVYVPEGKVPQSIMQILAPGLAILGLLR